MNDRESVTASRVEPSGINGIEDRRVHEESRENSYRTDESLTAAIAADTHRRVTGWQQVAIGRRTLPFILLRSRRPFDSKPDKPKELRS